MATYSNIYIDQGASYASVIDVKDGNGLPFNLTGYISRGQIRKSYSSNQYVPFATSINTPLTGKVSLSLIASQTRAMKAGRYIYYVEVYNSGGHVIRVAEGQVEINPGGSTPGNDIELPPEMTLTEIIDDRIDTRTAIIDRLLPLSPEDETKFYTNTKLVDKLALKAPLENPSFTGTPTAPTPLSTSNDTRIATTSFITSKVSSLAPLESPTFTGTPTSNNSTSNSLTAGALWLNGASGALLFDNSGHKRISWNDGGNLNIRGGNYYNGTNDVYATEGTNTNAGAAKITLTCDGNNVDGEIDFRVAPGGAKNDVISYSNHLSIKHDRFTIVGTGVNVGIGTATPSVRLDVDGGDIKFKNADTGSGISTGESNIRLGYSRTGNGITGLQLYSSIGSSATGFATIEKEGGGNGDFTLSDSGTGNIVIHKSNGSGAVTFRTGATAGTERMRIANDGVVHIGNGSTAASPNAATISSTGGSGDDIAGANLTLRAGAGTGTGVSGSIIFNMSATGTASGDTSAAATQRARLLPAGQLIVGAATSAFATRFGSVVTDIFPNLQILSNTTGAAKEVDSSAVLIGRFSNNADSARLYFTKSRTATTATHGLVTSGDSIGQLSFGASDGSRIVESARISVVATGTPAVNRVAGVITLSTTADVVDAVPVERMRVDNIGNIGIGTSSPDSKAILHLSSTTKGFLPPAMNTTQRNAMGTVPAGLMIYNNTSGVNAIQFFNGTGWKQLSFTDA
jgi:hypothetical protein